jgi:CRP/FNR family cyclic AMP-dependent transcriptional regulator
MIIPAGGSRKHSMIWIEAIGYLASGLTVLTYSMRNMFWLRVVAVLNCLAFLIYAALIGSLPIMMMEAILLPINAWRLFELTRQTTPINPTLNTQTRA